MRNIDEIIERKKQDIDCSEEESAEIKGWLRETIIQVGTKDVQRLEDIQYYFPLEYSEYLEEEESGVWESPEPETKVFRAMENGAEDFDDRD